MGSWLLCILVWYLAQGAVQLGKFDPGRFPVEHHRDFAYPVAIQLCQSQIARLPY